MEATVLRSFRKVRMDELDVEKGQTIKILTGDEKPRWHLAEKHGRLGYVPKSCVRVHPRPWFNHELDRKKSSSLLLEKRNGQFVHPDGSFVFRHSNAYPSKFALSVKYDQSVNHFLVETDSKGHYLLNQIKFSSLNKIVEFYGRMSFLQDRFLNLVPITNRNKDQNYQSTEPFYEEIDSDPSDLENHPKTN